jgi:hypothetical protein
MIVHVRSLPVDHVTQVNVAFDVVGHGSQRGRAASFFVLLSGSVALLFPLLVSFPSAGATPKRSAVCIFIFGRRAVVVIAVVVVIAIVVVVSAVVGVISVLVFRRKPFGGLLVVGGRACDGRRKRKGFGFSLVGLRRTRTWARRRRR